MSYLKKSTIAKRLQEIGFHNPIGSTWTLRSRTYGGLRHGSIRCALDQGSPHRDMDESPYLKFEDGRWTDNHAVHITLYVAWPRSMDDLERITDQVHDTFHQLCGSKFKMY